jgi:hypothetical protein
MGWFIRKAYTLVSLPPLRGKVRMGVGRLCISYFRLDLTTPILAFPLKGGRD